MGELSMPSGDRFVSPFPSRVFPPAQLWMESLAPVLDVVNNHPYLTLASAIPGFVILRRLARWRSRSRLPPGPKGFPIVGNLFDLATTNVWEQFSAWGRQYGAFSPFHLPPSRI